MIISVFGRVEKIVGENIDFQHFLLFLQLFLRAFFHKVVKLGHKWIYNRQALARKLSILTAELVFLDIRLQYATFSLFSLILTKVRQYQEIFLFNRIWIK